jgi:hypothetical protein
MDSFRMPPTISTVDLVRSWMGQALRATGAAVVVPVAVLVALSLSALGGTGLGGLGALSQIVSGPQVAGSDVSVDDGDSEIADAVTQLAAADPGSAQGQTPGGADAPGTPGTPGTQPNGRVPTPGGGGGDDPTGPGDIDDGNPPGGGPSPTPPAEPPPPDPPRPGLVGGVGEGVKDVTAGTPVAPTVEDAVDGLVETCSRLGCP